MSMEVLAVLAARVVLRDAIEHLRDVNGPAWELCSLQDGSPGAKDHVGLWVAACKDRDGDDDCISEDIKEKFEAAQCCHICRNVIAVYHAKKLIKARIGALNRSLSIAGRAELKRVTKSEVQ